MKTGKMRERLLPLPGTKVTGKRTWKLPPPLPGTKVTGKKRTWKPPPPLPGLRVKMKTGKMRERLLPLPGPKVTGKKRTWKPPPPLPGLNGVHPRVHQRIIQQLLRHTSGKIMAMKNRRDRTLLKLHR